MVYCEKLSQYDPKSSYWYSVDKLTLGLEFREDAIQDIVRWFSSAARLDVKVYPQNYRSYAWRNFIEIKCGDSVAILQVGFNSSKREDMLKGVVEFNPNKCFPAFRDDLGQILGACWKTDIKRFDIAIDIPVERRSVLLMRDNRLYEFVENSPTRYTEYLGRRNTVGRVKVYDKGFESDLDFDLTRVEITCDGMNSFRNSMPEILLMTDTQLELFYDLTDSDKVMCELLMGQPVPSRQLYFDRLGRRLKEKLKPIVFCGCDKLQFNEICVNNIITDLFEMVKV